MSRRAVDERSARGGSRGAEDLTRLDVVGPLLAARTGDARWTDSTATLIVGGKSNLTYELSSPAGAVILRRPPSGSVLATAHDMGREARIQQALAATAVPVARIVLVDDGEAAGFPFYVMQRVAGVVLRDEMPPAVAATPQERLTLGHDLVDVLAELHSIDPEAIGVADYGRPAGFLERQVARWLGQWDACRLPGVASVDELAARLRRTIPTSPAASIVHGDYRLDNCIIDASGPARIAAVLDWELSTLGDPLTDLGMLLFYWRDAARLTPRLISTVTTRPGFPDPDDVATRWAERTRIPIDDLDWYHAFARFKFAVIASGIAARVEAGAMSGQHFGDLTDEIAATAESGLEHLPS